MSKNKLIWNIGLLLIVVLSLPLVYAQTAGRPVIMNMAVNAAVIGIVLFMLQAMLLPNKPDKERVSVWFIIIAASLIIAYVYGRSGFIWESGPLSRFFNWYVLGNTAIIGAVLYFLGGLLLKDKKPQSPEGNVGMVILIIIVSLVFAVKIGNKWVWQQETVRLLINYLFGPQGILNPNWGLWTFLGASTLLSFFFNGFLLKDQGNKFINYALAILIASNMASTGVTMRSVIIMGEAIFVILLANTLNVPGKEKGFNWVAAIILVGWASAAATYGTPYQGILALLIGTPLYWMGLISAGTTATGVITAGARTDSWFSWKWILGALLFGGLLLGGGAATAGGGGWGVWAVLGVLGLLIAFVPGVGAGAFIVLGIVILILFLILRGENRKRVYALGVGGLVKRLNAMFKNLKLRRPSPEGREPQVIKENRHIIQANVAYTTRSEITFRYWAVVKEAVATGQQIMPLISKFNDPDALRKDIILYRSGDGTKKSSEGQYVKGWNWYNKEVIELLNEFSELIASSYIGADNRLKPTAKFKPEAVALEALESRIRDLMRELTEAHSKYKERTRAYAAHHILRAFKGIVLTMSNVTGDVLEHPQIFARPGAEFIGNNNKPRGDANTYYGDGFEAKSITIEGIRVPVHEVNQYGEFVEDINKQKNMLSNLPPLHSPQYKKPRRLKDIKDIIDYPHFIKLMKNIELDWRGLAYDIRWGIYHPKSRTAMSYLEGLKENKYPEYRDEDIHFINSPSTGDPALDLRALAYPGKNEYWGRERFDDLEPPPTNPFPIVSSGGLRTFLKERIEGDLRDKDLAHKIMKSIPADTMAFEKVIEKVQGRKVVTQPIGGLLSDEPAAQTKN